MAQSFPGGRATIGQGAAVTTPKVNSHLLVVLACSRAANS